MPQLENFISVNGAKHYDLNVNEEKLTLIKSSKALPLREYLDIGGHQIKIFKPDFPVFWTIAD